MFVGQHKPAQYSEINSTINMVEIMAMLLLAGLALASSLQLEFDEIDSLERYQFMELRPLAMEFSQHFRNITEKDLDLPSSSQLDSQCLSDMAQLLSAFRSKNIWALKSRYRDLKLKLFKVTSLVL